jgi:GNAT superfamily N-acetyltransferase
MLSAMGLDVSDDTAAWRGESEKWFAQRLGEPDGTAFAAFVVDDPELGVVSDAVGICHQFAPSPNNATGLRGEVFNVSTDPRRRRLGYARACLVALLDWFDTDTAATLIKLNATGDGIGLYTSLGFAAPRYPALQLRLGVTSRPAPAARPGPA